MTQVNSQQQDILKLDAEQRFRYLLKHCVADNKMWILTDEHGAVMMTTDDEDCIPVWPDKSFAEMWATGEWQGFEAKDISLEQWQKKWTPGLFQDDLAVVAFPLPDDTGVVLDPEELDFELTQVKKSR